MEVTIGKQLGRMMDVVVTLAAIAQETEPSVGDRPVDENPNRTFRDAIDRLREIHREIDDIKVRTKANEIKHAKQNLLTLRRVMKEEDYRAALEEKGKRIVKHEAAAGVA